MVSRVCNNNKNTVNEGLAKVGGIVLQKEFFLIISLRFVNYTQALALANLVVTLTLAPE